MTQSPQIIEFVNYCERIAAGPYYYSQADGRCEPERSGYADCSGLVVAAARHVGASVSCTNSWAIAAEGHQKHLGVSLDFARRTRGALVIIGYNEGQSGGSSRLGHIAVSRGDGTVAEAANRRAGILIRGFDGRGWNYCMMPPWFPATASGGTPSPIPVPVPLPLEDDAVTCIAMGKMDASAEHPYPGTVPTARPIRGHGGAYGAGYVILEGGARIQGDKPIPGGSGNRHAWRHPDVPHDVDLIDICDLRPRENAIAALFGFGGDITHTYRGIIGVPTEP